MALNNTDQEATASGSGILKSLTSSQKSRLQNFLNRAAFGRVTFTVQQHPYYSAHSCLNLPLDAAHFVAIVPYAVPNILIAPVEPLGQRNYVPLVIVGHRVRKLHLVAVEWNRVWIKQNKRSPRRFCFGGLMRKMRIRTGIRPWARGDSSSLHAWRCGYRTHSP